MHRSWGSTRLTRHANAVTSTPRRAARSRPSIYGIQRSRSAECDGKRRPREIPPFQGGGRDPWWVPPVGPTRWSPSPSSLISPTADGMWRYPVGPPKYCSVHRAAHTARQVDSFLLLIAYYIYFESENWPGLCLGRRNWSNFKRNHAIFYKYVYELLVYDFLFLVDSIFVQLSIYVCSNFIYKSLINL